MTRHSPITPGEGARAQDGGAPAAPRRASLVERAASAYDFAGVLRAGGRPVAPAPLDHLPPVPDSIPQDDTAIVEAATEAPLAPAPAGRTGTIARDTLLAGGFIVPGAGANALSEEFRVIKRQILHTAAIVENGRTLMVCSARPDEGKTFCTLNLALSLAAEKDLEVVLIDADFAKPEIVATLGLEDGPGLIDAIADPTIDVEACLIHTDLPHLAVLPAGRETNEATELLASARTQAVLARLRGRDARRIIIFDSPPALAASTAGVLATLCGQGMFVVRADQTAEADLREALELVSACPRQQLLLNGVEFNTGNRRFSRYYGAEG